MALPSILAIQPFVDFVDHVSFFNKYQNSPLNLVACSVPSSRQSSLPVKKKTKPSIEAGGDEDGGGGAVGRRRPGNHGALPSARGAGPSAEVSPWWQINARVQQGSRQRGGPSFRQGTRRRGGLASRHGPHLAGRGARRGVLARRGWFQDAARRGEVLA